MLRRECKICTREADATHIVTVVVSVLPPRNASATFSIKPAASSAEASVATSALLIIARAFFLRGGWADRIRHGKVATRTTVTI